MAVNGGRTTPSSSRLSLIMMFRLLRHAQGIVDRSVVELRARRAAGPQRLFHRCDRRLYPAPTPGGAFTSCAVISWSGDGCAGGCVDGYGDRGLWCTCPIRSGRGRMARSIRSRRHLLSIFSDGPVDHQHRHSSLETPRKLRRMSEKSLLVTAPPPIPFWAHPADPPARPALLRERSGPRGWRL
jgi:hypothetical protein